MSLFSKLFRLFVFVVLMPFIPMVLLLGYYQNHLKDNILETHDNLAHMVATSVDYQLDNLNWRLLFSNQLDALSSSNTKTKDKLQEILGTNPDFLKLSVLDRSGKEQVSVESPLFKDFPKVNFEGNPSLEQVSNLPRVSVSSFSIINDLPISEFIYPLKSGKYLYGVLNFSSDFERLQNQHIGNTGQIYLVTDMGEIYTGSMLRAPKFSTDTFKDVFTDLPNDLIRKLKIGDNMYVGSYVKIPELSAYVVVLQRKNEAYKSIYYTNVIIALFLLTIATLAYLGALTFAEKLGRPIALLSVASEEVSAGNLDVKIDEKFNWAEFDHLIAVFNQMIDDLKDYQDLQLKTKLSSLKEQIFRSVAHDLRAPLMGLQGYIYILQHGNISEEEQKKYLQTMDDSTRNLAGLLENVLNVSRLQEGLLEVNKEKVDINALVEEVKKSLFPVAEQKGILLKTSVEKQIFIMADLKQIRRVLTNLVSNAIKFTEKGFAEIAVNEADKNIKIEVIDTGIGISADNLSYLFQKFHQLDPQKPGYGLGLFISKQMIEAHGGTLEVQSEVGKGSKFIISLPQGEIW